MTQTVRRNLPAKAGALRRGFDDPPGLDQSQPLALAREEKRGIGGRVGAIDNLVALPSSMVSSIVTFITPHQTRRFLPAAIAGFDGAGLPVSLRCEDGISFLERWAPRGSDLVYCDPPYLLSTRRQHRRMYRCELEYSDHERLLLLLLELNCLGMISGYWSELYADLLRGWRAISFLTVVRSGTLATEWLWISYPEPGELHDYRYLGENFRERERIRRKVKRWQAKQQRMPRLERLAVMAALAEISDGKSA